MFSCWQLKIGFWLSPMVWAGVYYATNGQEVATALGFTIRLSQRPDLEDPRKCENHRKIWFPMGISSALDVSWVVYVVYDPQFSTDRALEDFLHEQSQILGAPHWILVLYIPIYKWPWVKNYGTI